MLAILTATETTGRQFSALGAEWWFMLDHSEDVSVESLTPDGDWITVSGIYTKDGWYLVPGAPGAAFHITATTAGSKAWAVGVV